MRRRVNAIVFMGWPTREKERTIFRSLSLGYIMNIGDGEKA